MLMFSERGKVRLIRCEIIFQELVGAYARGPAFSWVHCQHDSSTDAQSTLSLSFIRAAAAAAAAAAENQRVGKTRRQPATDVG